VRPATDLSDRFPAEMPCRLTVRLKGGKIFEAAKRDYEGFHTRPMSWETVTAKFDRLAAPRTTKDLRRAIVTAVRSLEVGTTADLMKLLAKVKDPTRKVRR